MSASRRIRYKTARTRSVGHGVTRPACVGASRHCSGFGIDPDGLHVTETAPALQDLNLVSHRFQFNNGRGRYAAFDLNFDGSPGLIEVLSSVDNESRRFDRLLNGHLEVDQIYEHLK